jgi:hypothetical protein
LFIATDAATLTRAPPIGFRAAPKASTPTSQSAHASIRAMKAMAPHDSRTDMTSSDLAATTDHHGVFSAMSGLPFVQRGERCKQ